MFMGPLFQSIGQQRSHYHSLCIDNNTLIIDNAY